MSFYKGWFMGISAVNEDLLHTAVLISPEINQSSTTCRLRLRYFLWDSGNDVIYLDNQVFSSPSLSVSPVFGHNKPYL